VPLRGKKWSTVLRDEPRTRTVFEIAETERSAADTLNSAVAERA